jgi:flavin-dependent dehydrogenase
MFNATSPLISTNGLNNEGFDNYYDVIVVGARAAGAATAMLLARRGLSVLAIDRSAYGSDTLSTHSLALPGVSLLSRWGLLDRVRSEGTPVTKHLAFHYGERVVEIDVPERGDVDGLYSPRRTLLDRVLVDAAVESGADVRHGVTMTSVTRGPDGAVNGVELECGGVHRSIGARFVVGADGVRSRVARQVGAKLLRAETVTSANVYAYFDGLPDDTIVNHYEPGHVVGVIPASGGDACVWVGMTPERFNRVARGHPGRAHADGVAAVAHIAERMLGSRRTSRYRTFPGTPGFTRQAWGAGWALVGDAAYFKDPVSAHGITDAFIGAELVAAALTDIVRHDADPAAELGRYQDLRDEMAAAMNPPVATVASLGSDMVAVEAAFRDMSRAMRDEQRLITELTDSRSIVTAGGRAA